VRRFDQYVDSLLDAIASGTPIPTDTTNTVVPLISPDDRLVQLQVEALEVILNRIWILDCWEGFKHNTGKGVVADHVKEEKCEIESERKKLGKMEETWRIDERKGWEMKELRREEIKPEDIQHRMYQGRRLENQKRLGETKRLGRGRKQPEEVRKTEAERRESDHEGKGLEDMVEERKRLEQMRSEQAVTRIENGEEFKKNTIFKKWENLVQRKQDEERKMTHKEKGGECQAKRPEKEGKTFTKKAEEMQCTDGKVLQKEYFILEGRTEFDEAPTRQHEEETVEVFEEQERVAQGTMRRRDKMLLDKGVRLTEVRRREEMKQNLERAYQAMQSHSPPQLAGVIAKSIPHDMAVNACLHVDLVWRSCDVEPPWGSCLTEVRFVDLAVLSQSIYAWKCNHSLEKAGELSLALSLSRRAERLSAVLMWCHMYHLLLDQIIYSECCVTRWLSLYDLASDQLEMSRVDMQKRAHTLLWLNALVVFEKWADITSEMLFQRHNISYSSVSETVSDLSETAVLPDVDLQANSPTPVVKPVESVCYNMHTFAMFDSLLFQEEFDQLDSNGIANTVSHGGTISRT